MSSGDDEVADSLETTRTQDYDRLKAAYNIAVFNLTEKNDEVAKLKEQRAQLTFTLEKSLKLVEFLLTEMRVAGVTPSSQAVFTKAALDQAMGTLIGMAANASVAEN
jgi:hypothetical protein